MLTLPSLSDEKKLEEAIADPDRSRVSYVLSIGDSNIPFGEKISSEEGEWGTDESGVCYLDLLLSTPMPRRLEGAPVRFYVLIDGVTVPQVTGIDSLSEIGQDRASTNFQARSAGGLANEITLDEEIEVSGWPPEQIVRRASLKLPYERGGVKVDKLAEPLLYFTQVEGTRFLPEQHPSDMYSAVQEKAPYIYRDTYTGGFVASASTALGRGATPQRIYNANEIRGSASAGSSGGWRPPPRVEERYGRVVVFRRNPDDSYAFFSEANVLYRGNSYPPQRNRTFYVELQDPTGDGYKRAQNLAYDLAGRFARGVYKDEMILPAFDPRIEKGDAFIVEETYRDLEATYQRRWLGWVEKIKQSINTLDTTVGYSAMLVFEDRLDIPALAMAGISGGVLETILGECDEVGDYLYFTNLSWIQEDGDYLVFADGAGTIEESGDYLLITCPAPSDPLWGENPVDVVFFDSSLPWVTDAGDTSTIDEAASGGVATVTGEVGEVT